MKLNLTNILIEFGKEGTKAYLNQDIIKAREAKDKAEEAIIKWAIGKLPKKKDLEIPYEVTSATRNNFRVKNEGFNQAVAQSEKALDGVKK